MQKKILSYNSIGALKQFVYTQQMFCIWTTKSETVKRRILTAKTAVKWPNVAQKQRNVTLWIYSHWEVPLKTTTTISHKCDRFGVYFSFWIIIFVCINFCLFIKCKWFLVRKRCQSSRLPEYQYRFHSNRMTFNGDIWKKWLNV